MLNIDALHVLSMLLDLRELKWAKKVTRRIFDMADTSELWTIARCAAILDGHSPKVARVKLDAFAQSLTDEHRRDLVAFVAEHTGDRPRRAAEDIRVPLRPLSVWHDTRPGYDEYDAQPTGTTVYPTPWETQRARRMAQLTRHLRNHTDQLPREARTALAIVDHSHDNQTLDATDFAELTTIPDAFEIYVELRRRGMTHKLAKRRATKTRAQDKAEQKAQRIADDYMRTGLNVDDKTIPTLRTVFDIDDDTPADIDRPDGYTLDYDRAARTALRATPCVSCFVERRPQDDRTTGHDDGLCVECRDSDRPGLPQRPTPTRRAARTVAYLNPHARAAAAHAATITARCAAVAEHLPPAAALVWIRAFYRLAPEAHRPIIAEWVTEWRTAHRPQPPTPVTPAAVAAAPVPALVAA